MIYLDYNATSPVKPAALAAMLEALEAYGNPSSSHRYGRASRRRVEEARASIAALVGVKPAQVVLTSGGTEANLTALHGINHKSVLSSSIEHDSVLAASTDARRIPVDENGVIDLNQAEIILREAPAPALVSAMYVNNETGVVQPISEVAALARKYGHKIHTDAVQAAGRLPIDFPSLGVDALSLSAHKIGGPQGIGALIVNEKLALTPLMVGGGQEMNRRAGTENVAAIVGFGVAAKLAIDDLRDMPERAKLRDHLQKSLQEIGGKEVVVLGENAPRVANTLCIALRGISSETQVMAMDLAGVAVSAGSACSSGKVKASHVARAMGFATNIAGSTLRISLGWKTTTADVTRCIEAWSSLYHRTHTSRSSQAA